MTVKVWAREIKQFLDDYSKEVVQGTAAIFAGAGLSVPAGFVDWRELLRPLAAEMDLDIDREGDLASVAQFHVNAHRDNRHRLHQAVIETLADNPPTRNHALLAKLPITTWWTTNYDQLIERALNEAGKVVDVKVTVAQLANTRPQRQVTLYKIHGDSAHPDGAVITRDDYECFNRDKGAYANALAGDLVSRAFLFLGFSFTDPNLDHILSQVRLTFARNQRRHFAIFRRRQRVSGEDDATFLHGQARQRLMIEDLLRFNITALLIDDYSEITDILEELEWRFRRQTIVVSSSAADFSPWGEAAVCDFMRTLGGRIVGKGHRIATGMGAGVGNALFTGAVEVIMAKPDKQIEDALILRPFPRHIGDANERARVYEQYRRDLVGRAGVALFLFGNGHQEAQVTLAAGVRREFEIAREKGLILLPIGATGGTAEELWRSIAAHPAAFAANIPARVLPMLESLATPTIDLDTLVDPIIAMLEVACSARLGFWPVAPSAKRIDA